jgi:hypothetical protein
VKFTKVITSTGNSSAVTLTMKYKN